MVKKLFFAFFFAIFFFVDTTIFYRVIIGNDFFSFLLVIIALVITAFIVLESLLKNKNRLLSQRNNFALLLFYILICSSIHLYIGQGLTSLIQYFLTLLQGVFLFILLLDSRYRQILILSYLCALAFHAITIVPYFDFLTQRLSEHTNYEEGAYSIGFFTRRATGFFNSPGQLSLFASGGLGLGLYFLNHKRKIGFSYVILSVILGFASFSRSFFIVFFLILIFNLLILKIKAKIQLLLFIFITTLIALNNSVINDYFTFISDRLDLLSDMDTNDRITGETGIQEVFKCIVRYPFFGNPIIEDGSSLKAWNGEISIRPHTGILSIITFYGIIFGLPLLWLILNSFKRLMLQTKILFLTKKHSFKLNINYPFFYSFIAINIICLVEPLIETTVYFFFLFGTLASNDKFLSIQTRNSNRYGY